MTSESDEELVERILAGKTQLYSLLVDRHKDRAMTLAVHMLKRHEDSEEALQDAFVRAFRALPSFKRDSRFATWFYRIVYNTCATRYQKLRAEGQIFEPVTGEERTEYGSSDRILEQSELRDSIAHAFASLPEHLSTVVTLFYTQELSYEEIVQVTGLPLGTVKTHLFRARTALKKALTTESEVAE